MCWYWQLSDNYRVFAKLMFLLGYLATLTSCGFFFLILLFCTMTNKCTQLFHKLSHSTYMFRHYRVIIRELVINTLPSYTIMSNAVQMHSYCIWHTGVTWQGIDYKLPQDDNDSVETCSSVIICEINVNLLVMWTFLYFIILYYDQQMHNYVTNYHTATCFDTIVS